MNDVNGPEHLGKWVAAQRKRRGMETQPELADAMTEIGPELVTTGPGVLGLAWLGEPMR